MNIIDLEPRHLDTVVEAHMRTWERDELSVRLGRGFVERFYARAIADSGVVAVGGAIGDEILSCWCLGFREYDRFNQELQRSLGVSFLVDVGWRVLRGRLPLGQVLDRYTRPQPNARSACPQVHLGAFGVVGEDFEHVLALSRLVKHVAEILGQSGDASWAVTGETNAGAKAVMRLAGFSRLHSIELSDRVVDVFEYAKLS